MRFLRSLFPALLLLVPLPLCAQWDAARHPLYDVTTPTKEQAEKAPTATELILGENADWRVTTTDKRFITSFPANAYHDGKEYALWLSGWRGERVSTQLIVSPNGAARNVRVSCTPLRGEHSDTAITPELRMVRYTLAHGVPTADIIGNESVCDNADGVPRPVWLQIDIPRDTPAGRYEGELTATAEGCEPVRKEIIVEVQNGILPEPKDRSMHVDFWQHPDAVARWHDVEPWSEAHFALMRPLMKRLADAGQKVITCAIIDEAWGGQTYDWFPSQIRWIQGADSIMRYDYTIFDKWVTFMTEDIGIDQEIFCYTMVPWSMSIRYIDEASGEERTMKLDHKDPSYERIWGHFLQNFREHLREKGWLAKTSIALDERPDDLVRATKEIIARHAPELKVISSVNAPSAESEDIYLVSPILQHTDSISEELLFRRKSRGQKTIFYTCLSPKKPNSFTFSPPAESEWLGLFAAAHELDGYSRWAYNSWNKNPFETTDFVHWPSGDCFMVYPGNLSSIRFERLRDGFEDYEKIRILRERAARINSLEVQNAITELDTWLKQMFTVERSAKNHHSSDVAEARDRIDRVLHVIQEAESTRQLKENIEGNAE